MGKSVQKINIIFYKYNLYDVGYDFFFIEKHHVAI